MTVSSNLQITTQLLNDKQVVTAQVLEGSYLPTNIFIYENTGTTQLGAYQGICDKGELTRLQVWTGVAIPIFGNKYIRYSNAKIELEIKDDVQPTIANLIKTATDLSKALQTESSTTQIVNIP